MAESGAPARSRRAPSRGVSTSDVVVSAAVGGNAELFPSILSLHVPAGGTIADVTFGQGVFWRAVPRGRWQVLASDLDHACAEDAAQAGIAFQGGVDCRTLPYGDGTLDALVLDPPYLESFYRTRTDTRGGRGSHRAYRDFYANGAEADGQAAPTPRAGTRRSSTCTAPPAPRPTACCGTSACSSSNARMRSRPTPSA